jgi:cell volume regulation protein A
MHASHELILLLGGLGLLAIFAGVLSARLGAPLLLVFLVLGMLMGEDGPGGIEFSDFGAAYLIGSVALATILFEGGLKTPRASLREVWAPSFLLATLGVAVSAGAVAGLVVFFTNASWPFALLIGAAVAPTDAAAISLVLRRSGLRLPHRVEAILELECGLNDPMSVFLTTFLVAWLRNPHPISVGHSLLVFGGTMVGGAACGLAGGTLLAMVLRRLKVDSGLYPILAFAGTLVIFGGTQLLDASGFLAVYLAGVCVGGGGHSAVATVERYFEGFGWLAQITLFLMLGLLATPHELGPALIPAIGIAAALTFIARPLSVSICLAPFRFPIRHTAFVSWVGLRGAVPIYLTMIPVLAGLHEGELLFAVVFVIVIVSLILQGWTIGPIGRALGINEATVALAEAAK